MTALECMAVPPDCVIHHFGNAHFGNAPRHPTNPNLASRALLARAKHLSGLAHALDLSSRASPEWAIYENLRTAAAIARGPPTENVPELLPGQLRHAAVASLAVAPRDRPDHWAACKETGGGAGDIDRRRRSGTPLDPCDVCQENDHGASRCPLTHPSQGTRLTRQSLRLAVQEKERRQEVVRKEALGAAMLLATCGAPEPFLPPCDICLETDHEPSQCPIANPSLGRRLSREEIPAAVVAKEKRPEAARKEVEKLLARWRERPLIPCGVCMATDYDPSQCPNAHPFPRQCLPRKEIGAAVSAKEKRADAARKKAEKLQSPLAAPPLIPCDVCLETSHDPFVPVAGARDARLPGVEDEPVEPLLDPAGASAAVFTFRPPQPSAAWQQMHGANAIAVPATSSPALAPHPFFASYPWVRCYDPVCDLCGTRHQPARGCTPKSPPTEAAGSPQKTTFTGPSCDFCQKVLDGLLLGSDRGGEGGCGGAAEEDFPPEEEQQACAAPVEGEPRAAPEAEVLPAALPGLEPAPSQEVEEEEGRR
ncbi:hypothetical protein BDK51DRAFT_28237 [Blyttiomyces helicus]|uniref:Uncharacterized protein n=1 Tax=Blyttiomyces helicus TaxID=388810 RepID=A0A4P9WBD0_9FUNG|nr:hypothetical protein BDK51DRAFT_28237 [Blyttiomyces helicus]|eukprot:RKO89931.1 hypothetical protein BDK51DRAFT_28237 [Blyttiomyces helicus]